MSLGLPTGAPKSLSKTCGLIALRKISAARLPAALLGRAFLELLLSRRFFRCRRPSEMPCRRNRRNVAGRPILDALVAKTHAPVTPRVLSNRACHRPHHGRLRLPLVLVVDVLGRAAQPVHAERATIVEQHRPAKRPKHLVLPAYDNARKVDVVSAVNLWLEG